MESHLNSSTRIDGGPVMLWAMRNMLCEVFENTRKNFIKTSLILPDSLKYNILSTMVKSAGLQVWDQNQTSENVKEL